MKNMKKTLAAGIVALAITLSSCEITRPIAATSNPVGSKIGTSTAFGILMFPPFVGAGNTGIQKAAKNGGITKIGTVDYTERYFFLWRTWTCTVTGE